MSKKNVFKKLSTLCSIFEISTIWCYIGILFGVDLVDKNFVIPNYVGIICMSICIVFAVLDIVFDRLYEKSNIIIGGAK